MLTNTAGYHYSLKHKRSTQEDNYHTCPHYGTVSIIATTISAYRISVTINFVVLSYYIIFQLSNCVFLSHSIKLESQDIPVQVVLR